MSEQSFSIRDVLKIRDYRWLWQGQIVSTFGDALAMLAMLLLVNRLSDGSPSAVATLMIVIAIPTVTIGLVAGALVDTWSRKRTMVIGDLLRTLLFVLLAAICAFDNPPLWVIYLFAFLEAIVGSFFNPARMALVPTIVPKNGWLSASSLGQVTRVLFDVVGTAAAGLLVGMAGLFWLIFAINAFTFLLSALCISRVNEAIRPEQSQSTLQTIISDTAVQLKTGFAFMRRSRVVIGILVSLTVTMLGIGAINVLMVPFVVNELQVSETWFGALTLGQSGAMIISGLFITVIASRFKQTHILVVGLFLLGLSTAGLYSVSTVWHLIPISVAIGLIITPTQAVAGTMMQTAVDQSLMGRVGAATNAAILTASLVSMFAAGFLAEWMGTRNVFLISGGVVCLSAVCAMLLFRGTKSAQTA